MANHAVNSLISYNYPVISAEPAYRKKLMPYVNYLRNHSGTKTLAVVQADARPYYHNLYGYLTAMGYDPILHWVIMLLSDIPSPMEFDSRTTHIKVPDIGLVDEIKIILTS